MALKHREDYQPLLLLRAMALIDPELKQISYFRLRELPNLVQRPGENFWTLDLCRKNDSYPRHFSLSYEEAIKLIVYLKKLGFKRSKAASDNASIWFWHPTRYSAPPKLSYKSEDNPEPSGGNTHDPKSCQAPGI